MLLQKFDKIRQIKAMEGLDYVGRTFSITNITAEGMIVFANKSIGTYMMNFDSFAKHFVKTKWTEWTLAHDCEFGGFMYRTDGKRIVVRRGGFKVSASCHPRDNFDIKMGIKLCLARLRVKEILANIK